MRRGFLLKRAEDFFLAGSRICVEKGAGVFCAIFQAPPSPADFIWRDVF